MATVLTSNPQVISQDLFASSSVQQANLGDLAVSTDGRKFRYVKMGGVAAVPGKLYQSSAEVTAVEDLTPTATAIGDTTLTTSSTVTVSTNQFANGWIVVTKTPGQGYQYKIKSHPAATAAAVTFTLEDPIQVALTTSSRIDVVANLYEGVIVSPATASAVPVGVAVYPIPASNYGYVQVGGAATVLADGIVSVGTNLCASNAVAGAVEPATGVQALVGQAVTSIADTEYGTVNLLLA